MQVDAYAPCPCGSGKKFKWCCQPVYGEIEKAFRQQANGQHEAALRVMEDLTRQFPANPEVWGRRAELLWENDRLEEAEASLEKALETNPNYAFGYFLRGMFRHDEGEVPGALLLYRQAAELCDPAAHDLLAEIYVSIAQCEVLMVRPIAVRAALDITLRCQPGNEAAATLLEQYFGEQSPYPPLVRGPLAFKHPAKDAPAERKQAWERALATGSQPRLTDAARAFAQLTTEHPQDTAAWFNLGLTRAWLGDNAGGLDAWDTYVREEPGEEQTAAVWALAEVLRFGRGMEEHSDWREYRAVYQILNAQTLVQGLQGERRLVGAQQGPHGISATLLDRVMPAPSENLALFELPRCAALLAIIGDRLVIMNQDPELLEKARQIVDSQLGAAVGPPQLAEGLTDFTAAATYCVQVRFPQGMADDRGRKLILEFLEQTFEERWLHKPLRSLNHIAPVDAAGHAGLRRKVMGLIDFQENLFHAFIPLPYDFDRLRRKLNLPLKRPEAETKADIAAMSAAELAALEVTALSDEDLARAFQAGQRLDARELAARFARAVADRPPRTDQPDRFPFFQHLIHLALEQGQHDEAMSLVEAGEKSDCEHNEGRRRNDYEHRRAQVHLRAGEPDKAQEVFARLIERTPSNLDLIGSATEAMLSARRSQHAAAFAEQGLKQARTRGDRDRAGYFEELLAAARRQA